MKIGKARWIVFAALVSAPAVGLAHDSASDSAVSNDAAGKPAGTATAPPISPCDADKNAHGIANIDDVAGSMGDGSRLSVPQAGRKPAEAREMPPTLPRGTKPDSGSIGNIDDAKDTAQPPSAPPR
jgi:hypothetical protein